MVDITVGKHPTERSYHIHKSIMCDKSDFFKKMFTSGFLEGTNQTATLPDDSPDAFDLFVQWVYRGTIDIPVNKWSYEGHKTFIFLSIFAGKYTIVSLMDGAMDLLLKYQIKNCQLLGVESFCWIYQNTRPDSRIRLYAARIFAFVILNFASDYANDAWGNEIMKNGAIELPDLLTDAFGIMRQINGKRLPDPTEASACDYHQHGKNENCPCSTGRKWEKVDEGQ